MTGLANISIHAPREGSDAPPRSSGFMPPISIHAPREGSDLFPALLPLDARHFYPRSPRGERRSRALARITSRLFLSTLPARGATYSGHHRAEMPPDFYPRSPRGERRVRPCTGSWPTNFYPRSPRGERHMDATLALISGSISIHAPREGSDIQSWSWRQTLDDFYPRSPRGERPAKVRYVAELTKNFYPRSPRGERLWAGYVLCRPAEHFYPRSPRGERPMTLRCPIFCRSNFYPRSPRGERRRPSRHDGQRIRYFYPRSPRGERPGSPGLSG